MEYVLHASNVNLLADSVCYNKFASGQPKDGKQGNAANLVQQLKQMLDENPNLLDILLDERNKKQRDLEM